MPRLGRRIWRICVLLGIAWGAVGCATVLQGPTQKVEVDSWPPGAEVRLNGKNVGTTPLTVSMDRTRRHVLELKREEFENTTHTVEGSMKAGWIVADVLFTGLIGVIVDAATESWYRLPRQVFVRMQPGPSLDEEDMLPTAPLAERAYFEVELAPGQWNVVEALGVRVRFEKPFIGAPILQLDGDARGAKSAAGPFGQSRIELAEERPIYVSADSMVYAVHAQWHGERLHTEWKRYAGALPRDSVSAREPDEEAVLEGASPDSFAVRVVATRDTYFSQYGVRLQYVGGENPVLVLHPQNMAATQSSGPWDVQYVNAYAGRRFYLRFGEGVYLGEVEGHDADELRVRFRRAP